MNLGECWLVRHDEVMVFMEREHCKTLKAYLPSVNNITDDALKWCIQKVDGGERPLLRELYYHVVRK